MNLRNTYSELIDIVEKGECKGVNIKRDNMNGSIMITPKEYSNDDGNDIYPFICFFDNKDHLILSQLYLENRDQGLGTKVVNYLIKYSKSKDMEYFRVRAIQSAPMRRVCEKCNMKKTKEDQYTLVFK